MNISSIRSSSALDALTAAMARQKSAAARTTATATEASSSQAAVACGPSSASSFQVDRSTAQLAGARGPGGPGGPGGPPPAGNPIAELDGDGDGAVSAEEFGLDAASEDVKQLFSAIDSDSDGTLSSSELSAFDTEMRSRMEASGGPQGAGRPPQGPPPPRPEDEEDGTTTAASSSAQIQAMLQRIAEGYLSSTRADATAALSLTA